MINIYKIEQLAKQVCEIIPQNIRNFGDDLEQKIRKILKIQLNSMDFVSHEEFEIQVQLLSSLQKKISQLEKRILQLENQQTYTSAVSNNNIE